MVMALSRKNINLMAPVGSYESLMAAVQGGADSVYFGVENLNMRARSSSNFSLHDMGEIMDVCQKNNLRAYLTVNTVIYDHETDKMQQIILAAKKNNVDAIIATDISVINFAREQGMEVHASTQLNISNTEAVKHYAQYADVMVLARELNLEEIKKISQNIDKHNITGPSGKKITLEMFIHGALCMAISGKCYLSLHDRQYSANRGECLQICRRSYVVKDKETNNELEIDNEYIMSPKDLYTIHFINKIIDAGVRVLKIEGRARSPEYVKTVTACYNEAITACLEGSFTKEKIIQWKERLSKVFNRGFWDGYYLGQRLGEWSEKYGSKASTKKIYMGKIKNYFTKIHVAELLLETGTLTVGDEILITGPTTGVVQTTVKEIQVDHKCVKSVSKGTRFSIPVEPFLRRADKLYKIIHA
jgi:U32 family peptidase